MNRSRERSTPRSLDALRTATRAISRRSPVRDLDAVGLLLDQLHQLVEPTVPQPSRPTRTLDPFTYPHASGPPGSIRYEIPVG